MKIGMKWKHINITIIQFCAPTNDCVEENKGTFHQQLQAWLESITRHQIKIVLGELNVEVINDRTSYEKTMDTGGCCSMKNEEERDEGSVA